MASVDVAIPCYQYGRYLRDCVSSVLSQNITDLRVLIIDNASTDNSAEIARDLAAEDTRVEVVLHEKNLGPNASYNEAIDWAEAEYFLLLDVDDILGPGALVRAVSILEERPDLTFTYGRQVLLRPDRPADLAEYNARKHTWQVRSGLSFIRDFCRTGANPVGASTVVRRTSIQKQAGHYRVELPYTDDMELWLRLACLGGVAKTGAVQAIRRQHPQQHSTYYESVFIRDFREREKAFESFFAHEGWRLPHADQLKAEARRGLGEHAYWSAISHMVRGQVDVGRQLFQYAAEHREGRRTRPPLSWLFRSGRTKRATEIIAQSLQRLRVA